jgi:hypothetical protein
VLSCFALVSNCFVLTYPAALLPVLQVRALVQAAEALVQAVA